MEDDFDYKELDEKFNKGEIGLTDLIPTEALMNYGGPTIFVSDEEYQRVKKRIEDAEITD